MGLNLLIETIWRCLIVVICLSTLADKTNFVGWNSKVIALTGIYWFLIPVIDEVKKIIKEKDLFKKLKRENEKEKK